MHLCDQQQRTPTPSHCGHCTRTLLSPPAGRTSAHLPLLPLFSSRFIAQTNAENDTAQRAVNATVSRVGMDGLESLAGIVDAASGSLTAASKPADIQLVKAGREMAALFPSMVSTTHMVLVAAVVDLEVLAEGALNSELELVNVDTNTVVTGNREKKMVLIFPHLVKKGWLKGRVVAVFWAEYDASRPVGPTADVFRNTLYDLTGRRAPFSMRQRDWVGPWSTSTVLTIDTIEKLLRAAASATLSAGDGASPPPTVVLKSFEFCSRALDSLLAKVVAVLKGFRLRGCPISVALMPMRSSVTQIFAGSTSGGRTLMRTRRQFNEHGRIVTGGNRALMVAAAAIAHAMLSDLMKSIRQPHSAVTSSADSSSSSSNSASGTPSQPREPVLDRVLPGQLGTVLHMYPACLEFRFWNALEGVRRWLPDVDPHTPLASLLQRIVTALDESEVAKELEDSLTMIALVSGDPRTLGPGESMYRDGCTAYVYSLDGQDPYGISMGGAGQHPIVSTLEAMRRLGSVEGLRALTSLFFITAAAPRNATYTSCFRGDGMAAGRQTGPSGWSRLTMSDLWLDPRFESAGVLGLALSAVAGGADETEESDVFSEDDWLDTLRNACSLTHAERAVDAESASAVSTVNRVAVQLVAWDEGLGEEQAHEVAAAAACLLDCDAVAPLTDALPVAGPVVRPPMRRFPVTIPRTDIGKPPRTVCLVRVYIAQILDMCCLYLFLHGYTGFVVSGQLHVYHSGLASWVRAHPLAAMRNAQLNGQKSRLRGVMSRVEAGAGEPEPLADMLASRQCIGATACCHVVSCGKWRTLDVAAVSALTAKVFAVLRLKGRVIFSDVFGCANCKIPAGLMFVGVGGAGVVGDAGTEKCRGSHFPVAASSTHPAWVELITVLGQVGILTSEQLVRVGDNLYDPSLCWMKLRHGGLKPSESYSSEQTREVLPSLVKHGSHVKLGSIAFTACFECTECGAVHGWVFRLSADNFPEARLNMTNKRCRATFGSVDGNKVAHTTACGGVLLPIPPPFQSHTAYLRHRASLMPFGHFSNSEPFDRFVETHKRQQAAAAALIEKRQAHATDAALAEQKRVELSAQKQRRVKDATAKYQSAQLQVALTPSPRRRTVAGTPASPLPVAATAKATATASTPGSSAGNGSGTPVHSTYTSLL